MTGQKLLEKLEGPLGNKVVPVIAGFSGRSESGKISILGRGGTDEWRKLYRTYGGDEQYRALVYAGRANRLGADPGG